MMSVAGDWRDGVEGDDRSAILGDITPGRVGPAAAPLGWRWGLAGRIGRHRNITQIFPCTPGRKIFFLRLGTVSEGRGGGKGLHRRYNILKKICLS